VTVCAGIDVGAGRLHCITVDMDLRIVDSRVVAANGLDDFVTSFPPGATVAVDAPAELSFEPHASDATLSPKFRRARCAEIALGREFGCWVPWVAPAAPPPPGWMATGLNVYARLREAGVAAIEVYPYAAFRVLTRPAPLPRKQSTAGIRARADALRVLGVDAPTLELWSHDALDALVGAVVARDHARRTARAVTCGHDSSAIWLPAPAP
jgi:predicted nuclease with RNAse H fold